MEASIIRDDAANGKMKPAEITITLTDAGGDNRPVMIRLRQLLKLALRGFRLRCTAAVDSTGQAVQS